MSHAGSAASSDAPRSRRSAFPSRTGSAVSRLTSVNASSSASAPTERKDGPKRPRSHGLERGSHRDAAGAVAEPESRGTCRRRHTLVGAPVRVADDVDRRARHVLELVAADPQRVVQLRVAEPCHRVVPVRVKPDRHAGVHELAHLACAASPRRPGPALPRRAAVRPHDHAPPASSPPWPLPGRGACAATLSP